ncbi:hypothetical protein [Flavobacterium sp.]|uniref:hypothetical protein n=1 Tax=Flavobacterium sp. TaxID=239 RepID=UPI0025E8052D|nr:hypothetical protein [Flavobacterium sp.]
MKTKMLFLAMMSLFGLSSVFAQGRTTVTANNSEISDNLDLRAVASIFGDSRDLTDFERRLNDPNSQISNLDLNGDNRVDYLRVIETVEGNVHLIVIQSVLGRDNYQDIATVEVERDRYNKVQVQVVGDVYMYGNNYIYEPVYAYAPVIYTSFWGGNYHPYYSSWDWGYYPGFYVAWSPFPVYTYHNHIGSYINYSHHYNYVDYRRCSVAYNNYYSGRRGNAYERQYPTRSFSNRNTGYVNRYELENSRRTQTVNTGSQVVASGFRNNSNIAVSTRGLRTQDNSTNETAPSTSQESPRSTTTPNDSRTESIPRTYINTRVQETPRSVIQNDSRTESTPRTYGIRSQPSRTYGNTRSSETPRNYGNTGNSEAPRTYGNQRSAEPQRNLSPREFSSKR